MSTRSHILLEGSKPMLYRHCDGYPGKPDGSEYGVLADLVPFLQRFKKERGWDPDYLLARMTQALTNAHAPDGCLSYGIDLAMHGDEEFIYVIKKDFSVEVRAAKREFWDAPTLKNTKLLETVVA